MNLLDAGMVRHLTGKGYRVFPPRPLPAVATRHVPNRTSALARTVTGAGPWGVQYVADGELGAQACSAEAWARWITKTRARVPGNIGGE